VPISCRAAAAILGGRIQRRELVVNLIISVFAALAAAAATGIASAEQTQPQGFPFEGGTLTISETDELNKMLTFDGKELTRAYVLEHNKTVELAGQQVALSGAIDVAGDHELAGRCQASQESRARPITRQRDRYQCAS
jgi:hypothetical protein